MDLSPIGFIVVSERDFAVHFLTGLLVGLYAQAETVAIPALMEEIKRVSSGNSQTNVIYLFVLVLAVASTGGFFLLRYVLSHAREIHSEANKTLLDISSKHEARCESLTKTFSNECSQLRQVILRVMSDARDMVHATRDIAQSAVTGKELLDAYRKKEDEIKSKRDRETTIVEG